MENEQREQNESIIYGVTTVIRATSRVSIKKGENTHYTFEYTEERQIPDMDGIDLELERQDLWEEAHAQVDKQVSDLQSL